MDVHTLLPDLFALRSRAEPNWTPETVGDVSLKRVECCLFLLPGRDGHGLGGGVGRLGCLGVILVLDGDVAVAKLQVADLRVSLLLHQGDWR